MWQFPVYFANDDPILVYDEEKETLLEFHNEKVRTHLVTCKHSASDEKYLKHDVDCVIDEQCNE